MSLFRNRRGNQAGSTLPNLDYWSLPGAMPWSSRRLNKIAGLLPSATTYLEIGVWRGQTFREVRMPFKWGVDPNPEFSIESLPPGVRFSKGTSDSFFAELPSSTKFDLIFLDGLHESRQTYRDILASLTHSHQHTIILVDDVFPDDDFSAYPSQQEALRQKNEAGITDGRWHGDVWKILPILSRHHPNLSVQLIGTPGPNGDNVQAVISNLRENAFDTDQAQILRHFEDLSHISFSDFMSTNPHLFEVSQEETLDDYVAQRN